tara:strand:+ start:429 stop:1013 length:585 start_codon:yes stop_codon:yes gene_type:complete
MAEKIFTNFGRKYNSLGKFFLIDTCLLAESTKTGREEIRDIILEIAENSNEGILINDFIEIEFLRGSKMPEHAEKKSKVLNAFGSETIPFTKELSNSAVTIANIYANKNINPKQISLTDCLISSYLQKYSKSGLVLVTLDNNDYPTVLHDRIGVLTIDYPEPDRILNIGFYKFNENKFASCITDFDGVSASEDL